MSVKNIKIVVAAHKEYPMPSDSVYAPVFVGATINPDQAKKSGFLRDDSGKNISKKNLNYCELTGLYWAWQNLDAEYIGLVHYRRLFKGKGKLPLAGEEIDKILRENDVILPKKRRYFIENLYDHYKHTMEEEPLVKTGEILKNKYPKYYPEFEKLKKRTSAHMFNMFVMKKEMLDRYCDWLFSVLFDLEKEMKDVEFSAFQNRFYGRVSELLLDVFLNTERISYVEVPVLNVEPVNWVKKGAGFLGAKFAGRKYEKSF